MIGFYAVRAFAEKLTPEEGLLRVKSQDSVGQNYDSLLQAPLAAIHKNELTDIWGRVVLARKLDEAGENDQVRDDFGVGL